MRLVVDTLQAGSADSPRGAAADIVRLVVDNMQAGSADSPWRAAADIVRLVVGTLQAGSADSPWRAAADIERLDVGTLQAGSADSPRGAAADRGEGVVEHHTPGRQAVQVGGLARRVPIDGRLETCIVGCKTNRNQTK